MKIDIFNHLFPQRFFDEFINVGSSFKDMGKRAQNVYAIASLDERFRVMDEFGDYCQVLSLPSPPIEAYAGPDKSPHVARVANDGLAELVAKYPKRFIAFAASLPMNNPAEAEREFDRAITQLGAKGVQLFTNVAGKPLDAPEFLPIFEEAARRNVVIWLHPAAARVFRTTSQKRDPSTKSGGPSAGRTKPAPLCHDSSFPESWTAYRT